MLLFHYHQRNILNFGGEKTKKVAIVIIILLSLWIGIKSINQSSTTQSSNIEYVFDDDDDNIPIVFA